MGLVSRRNPKERVTIGQLTEQILPVAVCFGIDNSLGLRNVYDSANVSGRFLPFARLQRLVLRWLAIESVIEVGNFMHFAVVDVNSREKQILRIPPWK